MKKIFFCFLLMTTTSTWAAWDHPTPVMIIESENNEFVWQSVVDVLWVDGTLIVADLFLSQVVAYGPAPGQETLIATQGEGPGAVDDPFSISLNTDGDIVVGSRAFGKCDVFDPRDYQLLDSYHLYHPSDSLFCNLLRVEWCGENRYDYIFVQSIDEKGVLTKFSISSWSPSKVKTILYEQSALKSPTGWNEYDYPPFNEQGWIVSENCGLWCPTEWGTASANNLVTGERIFWDGVQPCPVSDEKLEARIEKLTKSGKYKKEDIQLIETRQLVKCLIWDEGPAMLCRITDHCDDGELVVIHPGEARSMETFTAPVTGIEAQLFWVGEKIFVAVYEEEETYTTVWGDTVRGPCILVVRYDE